MPPERVHIGDLQLMRHAHRVEQADPFDRHDEMPNAQPAEHSDMFGDGGVSGTGSTWRTIARVREGSHEIAENGRRLCIGEALLHRVV
jgi:hypothetical protein